MSSVDLRWLELFFGRDFDPASGDGFLRTVLSDQRRAPVVIELSLRQGRASFRLGSEQFALQRLGQQLRQFCPDVAVEEKPRELGGNTHWARQIRYSSRLRPTGSEHLEVTSRALLGITARLYENEEVTVQWVLGPRLTPRPVPTNPSSVPAESVGESVRRVINGNGTRIDSERRHSMQRKLSEVGVRAVGRVLVAAAHPERARSLHADVAGALRTTNAAGVSVTTAPERTSSVESVRRPWRWPNSMNVRELLAVTGWPYGESNYPGVERTSSRRMPADNAVQRVGRVVGRSTFPGDSRPLALNADDALMHTLVTGPTGVGKSTLLANLAVADMVDGRSVVVIDPKGDLVADLLHRVPANRIGDVVLIDPSDASHPVGFNPLHSPGTVPELVADEVLAVFHGLYRDSWGPRTQDILHAALLTLAGRPDATLCALPVLLSNPGYRRSITSTLRDPVALGPFWSWFESTSDAERRQAIAPVMNKLRAFLLRPRLRSIIGQATPSFEMDMVFRDKRIVLVNLGKGLIGPEASGLLGSLIVSQLWSAALRRAAVPKERRAPVMCYVDEFQDYLHLPTDLADVLAQARGLGLGLTLANQHLAQVTPAVRQAVLANARSKICFQLGQEDASVMARSADGLDDRDFRSLGKYEIYASLVADGKATEFASAQTMRLAAPSSAPSAVRAASRQRWGRPVEEVDAELADLVNVGAGPHGETVGRRPRSDR